MAYSKRCSSCFEETNKFGHCQQCSKDRRLDYGALHLPIGYKLRERYLLGKIWSGNGDEYLGWDEKLNIKVIVREFLIKDWVTRVDGIIQIAPDKQEQFAEGVNRFLAEAGNYAKSKYQTHPNFLTLSDYFEANGTSYSVIIYETGITLRQHLIHQRYQNLSWRQTLLIVLQVMDAIRTLHEEGLLHLDISPDNIFLTVDERIILMGLSSVRHFDVEERLGSFSAVLKQGYAPPEQHARKCKKGAWTDVYSLGATLYRMLTGEVPPDTMERIEKDELLSVSTYAPSIPKKLTEIVHKALALKPEARYQTIEEMQQALLDMLQTESGQDKQLTGKLKQGIKAIIKASLGQNKKWFSH